MSTLNFNKEDKWIKKYYESRIKETIVSDKENNMQMELEKNTKKHGMKLEKKQSTKIEMEISIKDLNAKNVFSTLNRNDNIDFLAIKA